MMRSKRMLAMALAGTLLAAGVPPRAAAQPAPAASAPEAYAERLFDALKRGKIGEGLRA